jgi:hypothetical protein
MNWKAFFVVLIGIPVFAVTALSLGDFVTYHPRIFAVAIIVVGVAAFVGWVTR